MRVPRQRELVLRVLATGILVGAALGFDTPAQAQVSGFSRPPVERNLVLQAGQWYLDVEGFVAAVRAELPLDHGGRWLLVPGVTYAHYTLNSPVPTVDLFAPEALLQYQLGRGRFRPYVGGGAGLVLLNMFHTFDPLVSFGTGLRADLTPSLGVRIELDARAFGEFKAGSIGWSLGLAQRF
jgi:hypothetical protein